MRAVIVKRGSAYVGDSCRLCHRVLKAGQSIVVDVVPEVRFGTGACRRWHTKCLRDIVDNAPVGVDELNDLRSRIVATGDAFA